MFFDTSTHLTDDQKKALVKSIYDTNSLPESMRFLGFSTYDTMQTIEADPSFQAAVDKAEEHMSTLAEHEAKRRAIHGVSKPVVSNGKVVYVPGANGQRTPLMETIYSDSLLALVLKARNKRVFGDKVEITSVKKSVILVPDVRAVTNDIDGFLEHMDEEPFIDVEFRHVQLPPPVTEDDTFDFL